MKPVIRRATFKYGSSEGYRADNSFFFKDSIEEILKTESKDKIAKKKAKYWKDVYSKKI